MIWLVVACTTPKDHQREPASTTPQVTTPTPEPTTPDLCAPADVVVEAVDLGSAPTMVLAETLTAHLSAPATVAFACRAADGPSEVHLLVASGEATASVTVAGLLPDRAYDCAVTPVCPQSTGVAATAHFTTGSLPSTLPQATVSRDESIPMEGGSYTLVTQSKWCAGDRERILGYDPEGRVRWYDEIPYSDLNVGIEVEYLGGGQVFWGGGNSPNGAPEIDDVYARPVFKAAFPAASGLYFEHDARAKWSDPTTLQLLALHYTTNTDASESWTGFGLVATDLTDTVSWYYSSQAAVDEGQIPGSCCGYDAYHGNAIDLQTVDGRQVAYVSLYNLAQVLAIDVTDSTVLWRFGVGGDFALTDPSGAPLADDEFMQGQHGIDVDGDKLVLYDNGYLRGYSRAVQYTLDPVARTATEDWVWTDPGWYEAALGDVDWLPNGHALVDEAHVECYSTSPGRPTQVVEIDTTTGAEAWRLTFGDVLDGSYRAERVDLCDVTGDVAYCRDAAATLAEVTPLLGW